MALFNKKEASYKMLQRIDKPLHSLSALHAGAHDFLISLRASARPS
ncbi:hypothetical protein US8_01274 [Bacillus altitudinis]|nr:hypothetical protein US8_01274 [Bacillus altitudinis]